MNDQPIKLETSATLFSFSLIPQMHLVTSPCPVYLDISDNQVCQNHIRTDFKYQFSD